MTEFWWTFSHLRKFMLQLFLWSSTQMVKVLKWQKFVKCPHFLIWTHDLTTFLNFRRTWSAQLLVSGIVMSQTVASRSPEVPGPTRPQLQPQFDQPSEDWEKWRTCKNCSLFQMCARYKWIKKKVSTNSSTNPSSKCAAAYWYFRCEVRYFVHHPFYVAIDTCVATGHTPHAASLSKRRDPNDLHTFNWISS